MSRIVGIDVARGLAVLGMITAHVGAADPEFWSATGWLAVADGRSAATFAVLAGVSVALLSGGPRPADGRRLHNSRVRIAVRALLVLVLGVVLASLRTPIAVILPSYAAYFLLVLPFLRTRPRPLLAWACGVALVGPPVCFLIADTLPELTAFAALLPDVLTSGHYPAGIWMAYVLTGLSVGRLDLTRSLVRVRLVAAGAGLAVLGYAGGAVAVRLAAGAGPGVLRLLSTEPHADSTFEVAGNTGVALGVLGIALVVADRWPRAVYPVAATGALALTAYSLQIMAVAALGEQVVYEPDGGTHVAFLVITLLATSAWRAWLGRGPFEWALHGLSSAAADLATGRLPALEPGITPGPGLP